MQDAENARLVELIRWCEQQAKERHDPRLRRLYGLRAWQLRRRLAKRETQVLLRRTA